MCERFGKRMKLHMHIHCIFYRVESMTLGLDLFLAKRRGSSTYRSIFRVAHMTLGSQYFEFRESDSKRLKRESVIFVYTSYIHRPLSNRLMILKTANTSRNLSLFGLTE